MKLITFNRENNRVKNTYTFDDCIRKGKLNGLDTLEFTTLNDELEKYYRLVYKDDKGKYKEFIIVNIEQSHSNEGIIYKIYAEDSLIAIRGDFIEDYRIKDGSFSTAINKALSNSEWTPISETSSEKKSINFYRESAFSCLDKILSTWACEFETEIKITGSKVTERIFHLKNKVGRDLGKRFTFSKDIEEIKRTVEDDDIITALYGFGKGESVGDGYGRRINFADINQGNMYIADEEARKKYGYTNLDGSKRHRFGIYNFEEIEDKEELFKETKELLKSLSTPKITYECKVIDLKNLGIDVDGVDIGDIVRIRDKDLGLSLEARVLEIEEDLDDIKETTLVLGNYRQVLGKDLKGITDSISNLEGKSDYYDEVITNFSPDNLVYIDTVIENLNKEFQAGTSNIRFDENEGLMITDKKTDKDSNWAINISSRGFRIANSKKSDGLWNWRTFGTGDGFVADMIKAGVIRGGNSFWNLETGELNIGNIFFVDSQGNVSFSQDIKEDLKGEDGKDGETPEIEINSEGYWVINGQVTGIKAKGEDGKDGETPEITISPDGYWIIDGEKTGEKARGEDGRAPTININGEGYWIIDGVNTNIRAKAIDGHSPALTISNDGYWVIDGQKSDTKAEPYLLNVVYYPDVDGENPIDVNDPELITPYPDENTAWIGINNSEYENWEDWKYLGVELFEWSKFVGQDGEDAIIVSAIEPEDKTRLWRKSIDSDVIYMYLDGKWQPIDSKYEDILDDIRDSITAQSDKWEGDLNTNTDIVLKELEDFESELSDITRELQGKVSQEEALNEDEIDKLIEEILANHPTLLKLDQHFTFDPVEGLTIRATDEDGELVDTSVSIKNDGLSINIGGIESAYFTKNETLTPNLNVKGSTYLGNHIILGFNGYNDDGNYNENKNITVFAWAPRKIEE